MFGIFRSWRRRRLHRRLRAISSSNLRELKRAALHHPDLTCRRAAVRRIENEEVLAEILAETDDDYVKEETIAWISSREILAGLAIEAASLPEKPKAEAAESFRDEAVRAQLAGCEPDAFLRRAAVYACDSQALKAEAALRDSYAFVRLGALDGLGVEMAATVVHLAETDPSCTVRLSAIERLLDPAFASVRSALDRIAVNDREPKVRIAAVRGVTDRALRARIAAEDPSPEVRAVAERAVESRSTRPGVEVNARIATMSDAEMVRQLDRLCQAYAGNDRSLINELEPVASDIGRVLDGRGGISEMRRLFARIASQTGKRTLEMHWSGIGSWQG